MLFKKRADANTIQLPPRPKVLKPTGSYDGDDGRWSTFTINIAGDGQGKGQNFKVLVSTSSPIAMVPAQSDWCNQTCSTSRGILPYNNQQPRGLDQTNSLWKLEGTNDLPIPDWLKPIVLADTNQTLGGTWGLTTIGLGEASAQSITLPNQYVAAQTSEEFFLGTLGLSVGAISPSGAASPTFFSSLAATDQIASSSYGFTAGASYRNNNNGVVGNMVFGGYDKSRLTDQGTSISMPNTSNNSLVVGIQSILYTPDPDVEPNTFSFTTSGFSAIIDSTLPYLVLPNDICDKFAQRFGLELDRTNGLYTVNASSHDRNIQQNATVSFKIGSGPDNSPKFTTITLPYAAFDLQAGYDNPTSYFPLRKSGTGTNVLGRTLLQEAYIIVDYQRANFTIAPAHFSDPMPTENLITIYNTTYVPPTSSGKSSGGGISGGAIAGIVIGIVAVFLLLGLGAFFYWKKRRNSKANMLTQGEPSEIDTTVAGGEVKHRRVSELTGSEPPHSPRSKPGGTYYGGEHKHIGPISEMSPDSTPAELYSPQPGEANNNDYFATAPKPRRRGATRDSSGHNTPGTPVAELPGDEGRFPAAGQSQRPTHARGPSDNSLNIAEVLASQPEKGTTEVRRKHSSKFVEHTSENEPVPTRAEQVVSPLHGERPAHIAEEEANTDTRPGHARGLSDATVNSESTAVSQPTPEELEHWARSGDDVPGRPLSQ